MLLEPHCFVSPCDSKNGSDAQRVAAVSLMGDIFVSHHFRKQRLLPARRLFAFPNEAFRQSSLKGGAAAENVWWITTSQEVVAYVEEGGRGTCCSLSPPAQSGSHHPHQPSSD
jgi:hypothetical protein